MCRVHIKMQLLHEGYKTLNPSHERQGAHQLLGKSHLHIALANVCFVLPQNELDLNGHTQQHKGFTSAALAPPDNDDIQRLCFLHSSKGLIERELGRKKIKGKTTPFSVNLMRSQVLHRAAQVGAWYSNGNRCQQ